ncbi:MAG: lysophospholipid acyltransferase family protein [Gammaproteobacteria bacterium]
MNQSDPAPAPSPAPQRQPFTVAPHLTGPWRRCAPLIDRLLALDGLNALYDSIPTHLDSHAFARATLDGAGVEARIDATSLAHIPASGPCIVVANHPHGALDGVAMIELLMRRRPDLRVMANHLLKRFIELAEVFIAVDPFGGNQAARFNLRAVREALGWLRQGGMLLIFPGGEVSSLDLRQRRIVDPPWDAGVGWLVEKSGAPVVPAHIDGRNSALFQLAGLVHPVARTALLVREMLNHRGTVIEVRCAPPIEADTLALLGSREAIAPYLQVASDLVRARSAYRRPLRLGAVAPRGQRAADIAPPVPANTLAAEIDALPADQRLVLAGNLEVWYAAADQLPWTLQEIGRLRELAFRQVGEGTGKRVDLDLFDIYYLHLFVWDRVHRRIIGGYRLGEADRILDRFGAKGLYVASLFRLAPELEQDLRAALEVGRSFVAPEHQRNYSSLMLLWKGIASYVARHPRHRVLFGPVSISNDYHPVSRQLMVRFLQRHSMEPERASLVRARHPFQAAGASVRRADLDVGDMRIIASLLATVEDEDVGVPVLLRQYLKLNGRILGFNIDPDFNNAIDCLLWVDLTRTDPQLLRKYMGAEGVATFLAHHAAAAATPAAGRVAAP